MESSPRFELAGEVICSDIANARAVHRFVQKWIGQWIAVRWPALDRSTCTFHVIFRREGGGHTIDCEVRIEAGGQLWLGEHYGDTLSEALKQSLSHMHQPAVPTRRAPPRLAAVAT